MNINKDEVIKDYELVLKGKQRWKNGYWNGIEGKAKARICIRHLAENILHLKDTDYPHGLSKNMFIKNNLGNMLNVIYSGSFEEAFLDAIPEKANLITQDRIRFELKKEIFDLISSNTLSNTDNKIIIEKVFKWLNCSIDEIPTKVSEFTLWELNIEDFINKNYNSSFYLMFNDLFPGKFKPWQFEKSRFPHNRVVFYYNSKEIPKNYFDSKENREDALVWILEKLNSQNKTIYDLTYKFFEEEGLNYLLEYYNNRVFLFINEFYPLKARPWDFKEDIYNSDYWINNPNICIEALQMLFNKLNINKDNILDLSIKDFKDNHLFGLLDLKYDRFIFNAVNEIYPNEFIKDKWFFNDTPNELFLIKENRIEAVKNLIEKISFNREDILSKLNIDIFVNHNLNYLINNYYKGNVFLALEESFPGDFSKEDFSNTQINVSEYLDIFNDTNCTKLEFTNHSKEDTLHGLEQLAKIFTINMNSWVGANKPKPFLQNFEDCEEIIYKGLLEDSIQIYKFEFNEPEEPESSEDNEMFNILARHSRARNLNVVWLYWRAYNFFKDHNLFLNLNSVYMMLDAYDNCRYNRFLYTDNYNTTLSNNLLEVFNKNKSLVRCGELDAYRFIEEIKFSTDYFWVFPFEDDYENKTTTNAYVFKISEKIRHDIHKYIEDCHNRIAAKMYEYNSNIN